MSQVRDCRENTGIDDSCLFKRESIAQNPHKGRIVPEISNPEIRELIVKNYRTVYRVQEEEIVIFSVFEGHKLLRIDELEFDS